MEPGVVAAAYAVETAVEGAAVGAFVVSKPTAPIHIRFYKLPSPHRSLIRSSHTLNEVKGKAYIYGGDVDTADGDSAVHEITLPSDPSLKDIDYQSIPAAAAPVRPLAEYSDDATKPSEEQNKNSIPEPRAAHTAISIDSNIYVFGGRSPSSPSTASSTTRPLQEDGIVHCFDTFDKTWSTLTPHPTRCSSGVPCPRTYASSAGTPHPQQSGDHGTLFIHGGYDADGKHLRDVWAFDIASRIWSQWADVPEAGAEEIAGEGRICCVGSRLWRSGDGFGKVSYINIVRDDIDDFSGVGELGVSPKTGKWETVSFGPVTTGLENKDDEIEAKMGRPGMTKADTLPVPRTGAGFVPITTGAGREYLLFFMGQEGADSSLADVWTFQIRSENKTPAKLKDSLRHMVGKNTGEETWARAVVVESTKDDGQLDLPGGLSKFGCDAWREWGSGGTVIWGGIAQGGETVGNGWIMIAE